MKQGCEIFRYMSCMLSLMLLWSGCSDAPAPDSLMPLVRLVEATVVTRQSATLQGYVEPRGSQVTQLTFCYGTEPTLLNQQMAVDATTEPTAGSTAGPTAKFTAGPTAGLLPTVTLTGLKASTTYYYQLQVGNGTSMICSETSQFTTQPNVAPTVQALTILNQGPLSITAQFQVPDDGGEPLTQAGFYLQIEGESHEEAYPIVPASGSIFSRRIGALQMAVNYTLQPFASNAIGETRGERFAFTTSQGVRLTQAGTLSEAIDATEISLFRSLTLDGPLNGTDLQWLRQLMGVAPDGSATQGQLEELDMRDATIQSGGTHYDGQHYSADGKIGTGLFANVPHLQRLWLPDSAVEVERNAFSGAPQLTAIHLPSAAERIAPSVDCPQLKELTVSSLNSHFSSYDGVLFDANQQLLYWYPEGKSELPQWPSTLVEIAPYALQNSRFEQITLPATLLRLGEGAFYHAALSSIEIPDGVDQIAPSLFQSCSQLSSVTLGQSVSVIGNYSFDGAPLRHLYMRSTDFPPMCYDHSFTEEHFKTCTLHVPASLINLYRNATYWGRFERIVAL